MDDADKLYDLPLDRFTEERNRLAKELGGEAGKEVRALKKPTLPAWAVNQLARRRKRDVGRLLKAGAELRAAQEGVLASGERGGLAKAADKERQLVGELTEAARGMLAEAGAASEQSVEKVRQTLHAAASDEELAERLRAGRVVRDEQPVSLGFVGGGAAKPAARRDRRKEREAEQERREAEKELAAAEKALDRARAAAEEAAEELRLREGALERARERVEAASAGHA